MSPDTEARKIKVLFICSRNAGRSQMAEGYLNARYGNRYDARSAGFQSSRINPLTVLVMDEIGIDIRAHYSKPCLEFGSETFDKIVILTEGPLDNKHNLPAATTCILQPFTDPRSCDGSEEVIAAGFRVVRDEIVVWIDRYFGPPQNT